MSGRAGLTVLIIAIIVGEVGGAMIAARTIFHVYNIGLLSWALIFLFTPGD